jgi:PAS domain S-box-containing protein
MRNPPIRFALIYLGIGIAWTIITNTLINFYTSEGDNSTIFFIRSITFVLATAVGVYFVFKAHYRAFFAAERRYEQLFHNYPQPMWIYDTDTYQFLKVNRAALEKYGYSKREFSRLNLFQLILGGDTASMKQRIEEVRGTAFVDGIISTHIRKDGSTFFVRLSSSKVRFDHHNARMVTAIDISLQKEAEIKMETLLNGSNDLIWLLNHKGKLITWNQSFVAKYEKVTGISFNGEKEHNLFDLPQNDLVIKWQEYFRRAMLGEQQVVEETVAGERIYEILIEPITHEEYGSLGVGFFARNITERKKYEVDITEKMHRLREIAWLQSHELRRPLANILGLIAIIKTVPINNPDELHEIASNLEQSGQELDAVVRMIVERSSQSDDI